MTHSLRSSHERMETVKKLFGLALIAGIVVAVKKYLDTNPEAKRQVKEQANKAMGQAKHLAEEAGEKIKTRTSEDQDAMDRLATAESPTTPGRSVTTPNGPTTGTPTTL